MKFTVPLVFLLLGTAAYPQETETVLPRQGNVLDVLTCAGTNQVLWVLASQKTPDDRRTVEAKRKASWYAAVALSVFQVDASRVVAAIEEAQKHEPRVEVVNTALKCRAAPAGWTG